MTYSRRFNAPPKLGTTRANKYPGTCHWCKAALPADAGVVTFTPEGWRAQHRPLVTPTGPWDRYTGGCPGDAQAMQDALTGVRAITPPVDAAAEDREWAAMGAYVAAEEEARFG